METVYYKALFRVIAYGSQFTLTVANYICYPPTITTHCVITA